jgi:hypothetical protein
MLVAPLKRKDKNGDLLNKNPYFYRSLPTGKTTTNSKTTSYA